MTKFSYQIWKTLRFFFGSQIVNKSFSARKDVNLSAMFGGI